ncbi:MAG: zinc-ribbon domain-containing protein [candidate division Zixibacteria bacterium]|nr:zinc-ribbon domain-containing protein [candidate division Zixibacteria bacterium]
MPAWLRNIRWLDRALGLILALLASAVFLVAGLGVIIKSSEGGDKLFGVFLSLFSGTFMVISFRKLKRLYREAIQSHRQTCPNCRQEFTFPGEPGSEMAAQCPYCGHLVENLNLD